MNIHLITSYLFLALFIVVILIINPFKGKLDNEEENIKKAHKNAITIFILNCCFVISYSNSLGNMEVQILFLLIVITVAIYVFIYAFLLTISYLINKKTRKIAYIPFCSILFTILSLIFSLPLFVLIPVLVGINKNKTESKEQEEIPKS